MIVFEIRLPMTGNKPTMNVISTSVFDSGSWSWKIGSATSRNIAGEDRVDRGNFHLREDDAAERVGKTRHARDERRGQRQPMHMLLRAHRDNRADDHADQNVA